MKTFSVKKKRTHFESEVTAPCLSLCSNLSSFNNSLQTSGNQGVQQAFGRDMLSYMRCEPLVLVGKHCVAEIAETLFRWEHMLLGPEDHKHPTLIQNCTINPQTVIAHGCPSLSLVFPSHCHQGGSLDCWGFLCITVGSLLYNIKRLVAAVVIWCYKNKTELSWFLASSLTHGPSILHSRSLFWIFLQFVGFFCRSLPIFTFEKQPF